MNVSEVTITPDKARELLGRNNQNRTVSRNHVNKLARDMRAGDWRLNGDAIRVMDDGDLADGQHRLLACIEADRPFQTLLVTGLSKDDMLSVDRARTRNIGDSIRIRHGLKSGRSVAAAIRMASAVAYGDLGRSLTPFEYESFLERHPGLINSVALCHASTPGVWQSVLATIHYVGGTIQGYPDRADAFVQVMKTGVPDYPNCAAHLYRERMIREKSRGALPSDFIRVNLMVNAWRNFITQTPMKTLKTREDYSLDGWNAKTINRYIPLPEGSE